MPVVFDEVVGQVEPEQAEPREESQAGPEPQERDPEAQDRQLRRLLRRMEQRAERLRAN
jgi:hypothetical protein